MLMVSIVMVRDPDHYCIFNFASKYSFSDIFCLLCVYCKLIMSEGSAQALLVHKHALMHPGFTSYALTKKSVIADVTLSLKIQKI